MADAAFLRHPLASAAPDASTTALFTAQAPGWRLLSTGAPFEAALLAHGRADAAAVPDFPGAARYDLEQVSDTGPAAEPFRVVMLVAFDVPEDRAAEVDRWYDEEHVDLLMKGEGWLRARRYRVLSHHGGPRWTSMAFHELRDATAMDSPERAFARSTEWRARLEREAWFSAAGRGLFRLLACP